MAEKPNVLPPLHWLESRVRWSRRVALGCFLALMALLGVYDLAFADLHGARPWVILSIEWVPLLVLAPGVLIGSPRGHAWTCFVVNLYFIKGALAVLDRGRAWFGALEILASLAVFTSALLYARWRLQLNRKLAAS